MTGQDPSPIKEMLFEFLGSNDERLAEMASQGRYGQMAAEAVSGCLDRALSMAPREDALEALATGTIHYTLTRAAIPSQRKAEMDGTTLDVVVPGTRELRRDPGSALVILVACGCATLERRLEETFRIQPVRENVWALTQDCRVAGARQFVISGGDATLSEMIQEVVRFARERGQHRLGMAA